MSAIYNDSELSFKIISINSERSPSGKTVYEADASNEGEKTIRIKITTSNKKPMNVKRLRERFTSEYFRAKSLTKGVETGISVGDII